jgi:hypothetical protein
MSADEGIELLARARNERRAMCPPLGRYPEARAYVCAGESGDLLPDDTSYMVGIAPPS